MKTIQMSYCFCPDPVGGTEIYVKTLSKHLQDRGIETVILAPMEAKSETYFHNDLRVRRFGISKGLNDLSELYGEGDTEGAVAFGKILDEEKPDIVHLHAFTRAASLRLVREAKKRKIPIIFTYHTPSVSCQRGTLMRWGKKVCDGKIRPGLCTRCTLHGLGLPRVIADILSLVPVNMNNILRKFNLSGGMWTCLRMHGLISLRHKTFHTFMNEIDHIVVLCRWAYEVLLINGVPRAKITVSKHGLFAESRRYSQEETLLSVDDKPLRIAYMGRLTPIKGVDILIRAIKSMPDLPVEFRIYGVVQGEKEKRYLQKLKEMTGKDLRIIFENTVSNNRVIPLLKKYHILAVPSRWMETGPLTVLEAFVAGIPVLGSNLGGIAELVEHGINGLLVEPDSFQAWSRALRMLCENKELLMRLRKGIQAPRKMDAVADEMESVYRQFL